MSENTYLDDYQAIQEILSIFKKIDPDDHERLLKTVSTFLDVDYKNENGQRNFRSEIISPDNESNNTISRFSEDRTMSPKEFLFEKKPQTDVERIACLAYYLTHYRDTPFFKTKDLNDLNTEANQPKFSNSSKSVDNAVKSGYLVPASKGNKQISALGEQYVQALPDREQAKEVMTQIRPKRRTSKSTSKLKN